jgi:hypothetical protein
VVSLSSGPDVELLVISDQPTLRIPSTPGESFSIFRPASPGDGGTPYADLDASPTGDTTTFTDESPLAGAAFYFVFKK